MVVANPWAHSRTEDQRDVPSVAEQQYNAYAVPPLSAGDAFMDEFGWAPGQLKVSTVETPSAQRLQQIQRYDYSGFAGPGQPEQEDHGFETDKKARYRVEDQDADGWTEQKGVQSGDLRWADNPRRKPPAEDRPTMAMAPRTYSFTRYFDQLNRNYDGQLIGSARSLNGQHFSMADHRRKYDILTMTPARSRRNTYRLEPAPWDLDVVDLPDNNGVPPVDARVRSVELPYPSRNYRLG